MRKFFWGKGLKVYSFNKIDSTNNEAKRRIHSGQKLPALFIAKSQTAGKGTRGRSFYSPGGGLYMSLALRLEDVHLQKLTVLAAVATARAIEKLSNKTVQIKWVNDIYLGTKKLCGILCEKTESSVIIGVGVNLTVEEFPTQIKDVAVNLGVKISRKKLALQICENILNLISSDEDFMPYYIEKSLLIGKEVSYIQNGITYTGVAVDIDEMGGLIVENGMGKTTLSSGDVTLLK